jgi:hypothetical protein
LGNSRLPGLTLIEQSERGSIDALLACHVVCGRTILPHRCTKTGWIAGINALVRLGQYLAVRGIYFVSTVLRMSGQAGIPQHPLPPRWTLTSVGPVTVKPLAAQRFTDVSCG